MDGVESIMKNLDKSYIKVESGFSYGLHETYGFSRPFHSTSNWAEKKVTQSKL